MSANDKQIDGTHYKSKVIQPWDAMREWMTPEAFQGFLLGNCIKYLARHKDKGGRQDLLKAQHYLEKLLEVDLCEAASPSTSEPSVKDVELEAEANFIYEQWTPHFKYVPWKDESNSKLKKLARMLARKRTQLDK